MSTESGYEKVDWNPSGEKYASSSIDTGHSSKFNKRTSDTSPFDGMPNVDLQASKPGKSKIVVDLIYWRDVRRTALVFSSILLLLLSFAFCSALSVVSYFALAILTVTISFVFYQKIMAAVQKTNEGHPFKLYLDADFRVTEDEIHKLADEVVVHLTLVVRRLRQLFLAEDIVESLKFGLALWALTFIGAWFNGMTLVVIGVVGIFTLPKFYATYKLEIDRKLEMTRAKIDNLMLRTRQKIPSFGKKTN